MHDDTWLVHGGRDPRRQQGMVNPPVYHASTVLFETVAELAAAAANPLEGVYYGRYGTPLHFDLERAVARLEGGHAAVTTCSGLAAVAVALLAFAEAGAHLLVADNVYAPTRKLSDGLLRRLGVTATYFDPDIGADIAGLIRPETAAVFLEVPGSLTFEIADVPAIAAAARERGVPVLLDNTWATPLHYPAFERGADVSIQAATKYLVGHADAMLGLVTGNAEHHERLRKTAIQLGYCAGPDDVYLGLRGLRTLSVRLQRHAANAATLCDWLAARPEVARLLYPPRADDPYHELWRRDFTGASGLFGVLLEPCDKGALTVMLDGLELFGMGFSWGGYESLILPVEPGKHRSATHWSAPGPLLRIHAGLEDVDDLIADLDQGFQRLASN
jgi:cystathionine beta-lyase